MITTKVIDLCNSKINDSEIGNVTVTEMIPFTAAVISARFGSYRRLYKRRLTVYGSRTGLQDGRKPRFRTSSRRTKDYGVAESLEPRNN
jgi:hypothetical protein